MSKVILVVKIKISEDLSQGDKLVDFGIISLNLSNNEITPVCNSSIRATNLEKHSSNAYERILMHPKISYKAAMEELSFESQYSLLQYLFSLYYISTYDDESYDSLKNWGFRIKQIPSIRSMVNQIIIGNNVAVTQLSTIEDACMYFFKENANHLKTDRAIDEAIREAQILMESYKQIPFNVPDFCLTAQFSHYIRKTKNVGDIIWIYNITGTPLELDIYKNIQGGKYSESESGFPVYLSEIVLSTNRNEIINIIITEDGKVIPDKYKKIKREKETYNKYLLEYSGIKKENTFEDSNYKSEALENDSPLLQPFFNEEEKLPQKIMKKIWFENQINGNKGVTKNETCNSGDTQYECSELKFPIIKVPQRLLNIRNKIIELPDVPSAPSNPQKESFVYSSWWLIIISFFLVMIGAANDVDWTIKLGLPFLIVSLIWRWIESLNNKQKRECYENELVQYNEKMAINWNKKKEYFKIQNIINDPSLKEKYLKDKEDQYFNTVVKPNTQKQARRGASEDFFLDYLDKYFPGEILNDRCVELENNLMPYEPDFIYAHSTKNYFIDIEIDEPYNLNDRKPIHYKCGVDSTIDEYRDSFFLSNNWLVVRFSEEQVVTQPVECCYLLATTISKYFKESKYFANFERDFLGVGYNLFSASVWDEKKATEMEQNSFRENLLKTIGKDFKRRPIKVLRQEDRVEPEEDDLPF